MLSKGGHVSCRFQALGIFLSSAPEWGQRAVWGNALQWWYELGQRAPWGAPACGNGLQRPNLSFLACKTCVLLTCRSCMKQTRAPFFPRRGPEMASSCLSFNSFSSAPMVGGQAGTRGDKVAPPKHVSETKNNPQENCGKDYAEGEGKTSLRCRCSLRLTFQGAGLTLLLYDLSSVAFWTSPSPPGHRGSATALTVSGCWLCLTMGGRMRKGGTCFNRCLDGTSPCPGRNSPVACNLFPVWCWDWA